MKFPFEMAFWLVLGRLAFKRDILPQSNSSEIGSCRFFLEMERFVEENLGIYIYIPDM